MEAAVLVPHFPKVARHKTALALALTVATLGSAGTALALIGSGTGSVPQPRPSEAAAEATAESRSEGSTSDQVAETADPESFAISVAQVLFSWDTSESTPLNEYTGRLLAVADPSGEEAVGLATDLTTYLPSPESWADLNAYETRQWLDINSYEIPEGWTSAEGEADSTDLVAGTTAYTITGLRRRSGIWQGEIAQTVDEVSFTIFMTCQPTYDTCRLLRLSQLNNPLR